MTPLFFYNLYDLEYVGDIHFQKGFTHYMLGNYELAILSLEKPLNLKRKAQISEESETIADILFCLGVSHFAISDLTTALATIKRSLVITVKLFFEKRYNHRFVVVIYTKPLHLCTTLLKTTVKNKSAWKKR